MNETDKSAASAPAILLVMTFVTGIVDAVSYLGLGRVFTANMTGNTVLLGFAIGGAPGLSILRSLLALLCFLFGAIIGGKMIAGVSPQDLNRRAIRAAGIEALILLIAAAISIGLAAPYADNQLRLQSVVALTAIAMGVRNAVVRRLGVPDLTTTVLTLTITGLAADSTLAGGQNPRWQRRVAAIMAMLAGAAAGAFMLNHSIALPLSVCGVITGASAVARSRTESKTEA